MYLSAKGDIRFDTFNNKVLPKAGRNGFVWTFVQGSTFILRLNFVLKIPAFGNTRNVICNRLNKKKFTTTI